MESIRGLDLVVLLVYLFGIAGAGFYFSFKNKTTEDYFLGGRNFPGWAIGLSLVGTSISSMTFLGYPGDAYKTAYLRLLITFTMPIAIILAVFVFLPFFRRGRVTSAFEYLEARFGPSTRVYGAFAFIAAQMLRLAQILFLISLLVHEVSGLAIVPSIIIGGIFVSFYTVLGGIEAVVWTDVIQTVVLFFGGAVCVFVIVNELPGGLGQIFSEASAAGKFRFAELNPDTGQIEASSWSFSLLKKTALMMLFVGLTQWLTEYSSNQNVIQRYCAAKSMREARKALWVSCVASLTIWVFFMFIGTSLWVYYQNNPSVEAAMMLTGEKKAEQILPFFVLTVLPAGIGGLVVAAALAAAMSSLDSSINAISTVTIVDVYRRHLVKDKDDKHYLNAARWVAVGVGVLMIIGALILNGFKDIKTLQDVNTILASIFAGGLMGLFFLGFFTRVADGRAVGVAIVFTIMYTLYRSLEGLNIVPAIPVDQYYTGIFGHMIMFGVGGLVGLFIFRAPADRDLTNLTVWTQDGEPIE